jgi:hypothetical protein
VIFQFGAVDKHLTVAEFLGAEHDAVRLSFIEYRQSVIFAEHVSACGRHSMSQQGQLERGCATSYTCFTWVETLRPLMPRSSENQLLSLSNIASAHSRTILRQM